MRTKIGIFRPGFGILFLLLVEVQAIAHHSWISEYDGSEPVTIEAVVTKVEWTNPHAHFYVDSMDENGTVTSWNFEMASVLSLERGGWSRRTLQIGDEVTVGGFSGRAIPERAIASSIITSDGRSLFIGKPGD